MIQEKTERERQRETEREREMGEKERKRRRIVFTIHHITYSKLVFFSTPDSESREVQKHFPEIQSLSSLILISDWL